jgi:hypothetical protein
MYVIWHYKGIPNYVLDIVKNGYTNTSINYLSLDLLNIDNEYHIDKLDIDSDIIYILECYEEGIRYKYVYIYFFEELSELLEFAKDYLEDESLDNSDEIIQEMLNELKEYGDYRIRETKFNDIEIKFYKKSI